GQGAEISIPGTDIKVPCMHDIKRGRYSAYFREDAPHLTEPGGAQPGEIKLPGEIVARGNPGGHYRYTVEGRGRHGAGKGDVYWELASRVELCLPIRLLHLFPR